jgi:Ca2+-binding RTX toxin-like protein
LYGENGDDSFNSFWWLEDGFNYIDGGNGIDSYQLRHGSLAIADADGVVHVSTRSGAQASVTNVENWYVQSGNPGTSGVYVSFGTLKYDVKLTGGAANDFLLAGSGNDTINGSYGDDFIDGGAGNDTAVLYGSRSDYTLGYNAQGHLTVAGTDGMDTLVSIEWLKFTDGTLIDLSEQQPSNYML